MPVRIVTDSACDISLDEAAELNIKIVPLSIRFGEEEFTDLADISVTEFYQKMEASHLLPATAAPSPGAFENAFRKCHEEGASGVVCINLSIALSATGQAAQLAAEGVKDLPLTITDAVGGGIDGAISIFEDSLLAPGSLSGVGLSILKGITGDVGATKEGFAKFLPLERAFETSINNILPMTSQLSNILAESGLADAIPAIETAGPLVTTTVSQILQEYQSKLLEIQNINEMPDMMADLVDALKQIALKTEKKNKK